MEVRKIESVCTMRMDMLFITVYVHLFRLTSATIRQSLVRDESVGNRISLYYADGCSGITLYLHLFRLSSVGMPATAICRNLKTNIHHATERKREEASSSRSITFRSRKANEDLMASSRNLSFD